MSAPKGNLNALKHGQYSRRFQEDGSSVQMAELSDSLEQEITLLREMIRRTMALADGTDDLREATRALDSLGAASARLANLLRAQKIINDRKSSAEDALSIAIRHVNEELRRKNEP